MDLLTCEETSVQPNNIILHHLMSQEKIDFLIKKDKYYFNTVDMNNVCKLYIYLTPEILHKNASELNMESFIHVNKETEEILNEGLPNAELEENEIDAIFNNIT